MLLIPSIAIISSMIEPKNIAKNYLTQEHNNVTIQRIERTTIAAVDCVNSMSHVVQNCLSFVEPILLPIIFFALAGVGIFLFGLVSILACLKPKLKRLPIEALSFPVPQSSNSSKQSFKRSSSNRVFKQKNRLR